MPLEKDEISEIAPNRLKFFGGPGQMLCPCPATVADILARVPKSQLITSDLLTQALALRFKVRGVCPVTTRVSLKAAASTPDTKMPHWRYVKATGELLNMFPGGADAQAALLEKEGFTIEWSGKTPRVQDYQASLVKLKQLC